MEIDQNIRRRLVERAFQGRSIWAGEQGGKTVVAQVLEQGEALCLVDRENFGSAVTHAAQQACDSNEGADGMPRRRVVHEHGRRTAAREPLVVPCRRVAGERPTRGIAPAYAHGEVAPLPLTLAHASPSRSSRGVAANTRRGPCGVIEMSRASSPPRREAHLQPISGHQVAELFRPFDQRNRSRERVLDTELVGVLRRAQAVEIEVPDCARRVLVELHQGEGGAGHLLRRPAEPGADEGPCEGGLAAAKRPAEPDYIAEDRMRGEALREPLGLLESVRAHGKGLARCRALAPRGARRPIVSIGSDRA